MIEPILVPHPTPFRPFRDPCGACRDCEVRTRAICAALDDREVRELEAIMSAHSLDADQTLVEVGAARVRVYSLTSGLLRVLSLLPDGRRQITGFLVPGDYIGLADDKIYSQTIEAVMPSRLCSFPVKRMDALMARFPRLRERLLVMTREALGRASENQILLGRLAPLEKVASFLLICGKRMQGATSDEVKLPMTRSDIADYLGLTVETVSRSFTKLKTRGVIELPDPHHARILDREALEALTGRRG